MTDIEAKALALPDRLRLIPDRNGLMYDEYDDVMEAADLIEQLRVEAEAQYDRGYYDGCTHPIVRNDALREALERIEALQEALAQQVEACFCLDCEMCFRHEQLLKGTGQ